MDNIINILEEFKTKYNQLNTKSDKYLDNIDLCNFLELLVSHKKIINNIYYLKKKVVLMLKELFIKYNIEVICDYYYKIFNRSITKLDYQTDNSNENRLDIFVRYIQTREHKRSNKMENNTFDSDITVITI